MYTGLGPNGTPKCPNCGNSSQNAVPSGSPRHRRCATCKTVWEPNPKHLLDHIAMHFGGLYSDELKGVMDRYVAGLLVVNGYLEVMADGRYQSCGWGE